MSADFWISSTATITWDEFYPYLRETLGTLGFTREDADLDPDPDEKTVWFDQPKLYIQIRFSLIYKNDRVGFLIQQSIDKLHLPFETAISIAIYSRDGLDKADYLALKVLCLLAEKWPVIAQNSSGQYYTNDELFQRLRDHQEIIP